MVPVLGAKREAHFRHKHVGDCNLETYLHRYAKWYIKNHFENHQHFFIEFYQRYSCCKKDDCLYRKGRNIDCTKYEYTSFDLKQFYDTCELEAEYKGFIADVKLSSKAHPNREPLFIEVAVTHKCEQKKLDSGIRIIEISLPRDTDDFSFLNKLRDTRDEWEMYYPPLHSIKEETAEILFHNFTIDARKPRMLDLHSFNVFFINKNGKAQISSKPNPCSEYGAHKYVMTSPFEIHYTGYDYTLLIAIAHQAGFRFPNCYLCHYHWIDHYEMHRCNRHQYVSSPSIAMNCPDYAFEDFKVNKIISNYKAYKSLMSNDVNIVENHDGYVLLSNNDLS